MTRCSICSFPQVKEVDVLLASGTSMREVARLYGFSRTTVARHRQHVPPPRTRFGVIANEAGPDGSADPLTEALLLAERARTPRERLRALEQVRGATKLALRGVGVDDEGLDLLDRNIRDAKGAYRERLRDDGASPSRAAGGDPATGSTP
jgi:hypothetical protein